MSQLWVSKSFEVAFIYIYGYTYKPTKLFITINLVKDQETVVLRSLATNEYSTNVSRGAFQKRVWALKSKSS